MSYCVFTALNGTYNRGIIGIMCPHSGNDQPCNKPNPQIQLEANVMTLPVLYSLRNCPYAMRARLAIYKSKQPVALRDIVLKNKPPEMLAASPKATVPVLVLTSANVLDESLHIMLWALGESDPHGLLRPEIVSYTEQSNGNNATGTLADALELIHQFDHEFKTCLEAYKCAKRYHENNLQDCRQACEVHIQDLEQRLCKHKYVIDDTESIADIALLPFIRQFAKIERQWYLQSPYPHIKFWLDSYLQSPMFTKVMAKYPLWSPDQPIIEFGDHKM
ncbi:glutathione S-transferase domain-containing protein [Paraglaciecola polaris LMG 21857]|uniref:Glutathione S-transferase domain-containing protein n=2 Tax=Paraglaciecola polaris TaxID=222814 RepID=K6ZWF1_9ALTE|nr:glutathione S-transferase domain-containing protein [Paraglaciecola polaris LMG 21857]